MSWSIDVIGNPENVAMAFRKYADSLSGQSRREFDEVLPHLEALTRQNFGDRGLYPVPMIHVSASGSGLVKKLDDGDRDIQRSCSVKIERVYLNLV